MGAYCSAAVWAARHCSFFGFDLPLLYVIHECSLLFLHRRYKTQGFAEQLLDIIHALRLASWSHQDITVPTLKIQKVSGSLTNAVFFVSCPSIPHIPILLLRIYGPSSGSLISRPRELHILHSLSSRYHIGARVYGTFENGRVEEYFDSSALTAKDLRDPKISSWIGARMAELHQVDIAVVEQQTPPASPTFGGGSDVVWPIAVTKNVKSWLAVAREVLSLPAVSEETRMALNLDQFRTEWDQYIRWLGKAEKRQGSSPIVFAHNDAQYGNLLKLTTLKADLAGHRQVKLRIFLSRIQSTDEFSASMCRSSWLTSNMRLRTQLLSISQIIFMNGRPTITQMCLIYCALSAILHSTSDATITKHTWFTSLHLRNHLRTSYRDWTPKSVRGVRLPMLCGLCGASCRLVILWKVWTASQNSTMSHTPNVEWKAFAGNFDCSLPDNALSRS